MNPTHDADRVLVEHMLACIDAITEFLGGDTQSYVQSRMVRDACLRNLQILTESSQRLSEPLKSDHPEIPWRSLSGFRNLLVHDYLGGIDDQAVLVVLDHDLSKLQNALVGMKSALSR